MNAEELAEIQIRKALRRRMILMVLIIALCEIFVLLALLMTILQAIVAKHNQHYFDFVQIASFTISGISAARFFGHHKKVEELQIKLLIDKTEILTYLIPWKILRVIRSI